MKTNIFFYTIKNIITFTCLFCSINSSSQPLVTQEWVVTINRNFGPINDKPFLALDKHGNSYVAGTFKTNPNDTINILCIKYNTSGVQQWYRLYKYPNDAYFKPTGLALDSSGNAYVISLYGQNSYSYTPKNILLVKFSTIDGFVVWAKKYSGQYVNSYPAEIQIDRLNNIYVSGNSDSSHLIIKYNTNGDTIWVRKNKKSGLRELIFACTIDDSLNIISIGSRRHCVWLPPGIQTCYDTLLIVKYSSNGELRWLKTYPYLTSEQTNRKIAADKNGNTYLSGSAFGSLSDTGKYIIMKHDMNGMLQWIKFYKDQLSTGNNLRGMALDSVNNFLLITGQSYSYSNIMAVTIKYNIMNGETVWIHYYSGNAGGEDIKTDKYGNAYITGALRSGGNVPFDILNYKYNTQGGMPWYITYSNSVQFAETGVQLFLDTNNNIYSLGTSDSSTKKDYVLIKYSQLTGINTINNNNPEFCSLVQNYPNPFNPKTKIKFNVSVSKPLSKQHVLLIIYNTLGQKLVTLVDEKIDAGTYEVGFNASNYPSGVYFYTLTAGEFRETKKMILIK